MLAHVSHTQIALGQLQAKRTSIVAGAAAATNIAIAGITQDAHLLSVIQMSGGVPADATADASVTSAGNIQLATINSTGDTLMVEWVPAPSPLLP